MNLSKYKLLTVSIALLNVFHFTYGQEVTNKKNSKFLKFTGQWGGVLQANDFLAGDSATGEPYSKFYDGRVGL